MIHLDFETYSPRPIKDYGQWAYNHHIDADTVCMAYAFGDSDVRLWTPLSQQDCDPELYLNELKRRIRDGERIAAWNAEFEYTHWQAVCVPRYGFPPIKISQMIDVQAIALSLGLPGKLDKCARTLGHAQLKDPEGERLINKLSKPRSKSESKEPRWSYEEATQDYRAFFNYCRQDVVVEREIHNRIMRHDLSAKEKKLWNLTVKMNQTGVPIENELVHLLLKIVRDFENKLNDELSEITGGIVTRATQVERIKKYMGQLDYPIESLGAKELENYLADPDLEGVARRILEIRRAIGLSSTGKLKRMIDMRDDDSRVHDLMVYHRAATGRWGGSGIQIQNLPKDKPPAMPSIIIRDIINKNIEQYGNPAQLAKSMIRAVIRAAPGYKLTIADYSSIEARVLAWLAMDAATIKIFETADIYKWFATQLYLGTSYLDITKEQRNLGKQCILGLGYMMGADKFKITCAGYGIILTDAQARYAVGLYRRTFGIIRNYWYSLYETAKKTIRFGGNHPCGRLRFSRDPEFLYTHLPGGRKLSYYQPTIENGTYGDEICYVKERKPDGYYIRDWINPSKLIENAVQATARDIMADAMLQLADNGYNILFSVHDEIISHDPIAFGNLKQFINIMCKLDKRYYQGLPITAEGEVTDRYKK